MAYTALQGQGIETNVKSLSIVGKVQGRNKSVQVKVLMCRSKLQYQINHGE